jgi:ATP-dependent DNA ligase
VLRPLVVSLAGHPWEHGFHLAGGATGRLPGAAGRWSPEEMEPDWVPVAPELVCEVAYDQLDDSRFRHPARFRRWRPDRDPATCTLDQLVGAPVVPSELLAL